MAFMVAFHGCLRNTECTGKSPDPLYFFIIKRSGTETNYNPSPGRFQLLANFLVIFPFFHKNIEFFFPYKGW